jgi:pyridoxine 4-dehydrogenase
MSPQLIALFTMTKQPDLGGSLTFAKASLLSTAWLWRNATGWSAGVGTSARPRRSVRVLKEAIDAGVNHIDTSDFYGPHVTNQIIKRLCIRIEAVW